jgi:hypothetical protein
MENPLLSFLQLFKPISKAEQTIIAAAFGQRLYKEGDIVFQPNRICREMHFICKGILKIVTHNEKGNEVTLFFLKENQFCTILNSFNNATLTSEGIEAACDAETELKNSIMSNKSRRLCRNSFSSAAYSCLWRCKHS